MTPDGPPDRRRRAAHAAARWAALALDAVLVVLVAAVVAIAFAQVVFRYALERPLVWSGEASSLLFVWLVALGAVRAVHMRITVLVDAFPPWLARLCRWLALLVILSMLAVLARGGVRIWQLLEDDRYMRLPLSPGALFFGIALGAALWGIVAIWRAATVADAGPADTVDPKSPAAHGSPAERGE